MLDKTIVIVNPKAVIVFLMMILSCPCLAQIDHNGYRHQSEPSYSRAHIDRRGEPFGASQGFPHGHPGYHEQDKANRSMTHGYHESRGNYYYAGRHYKYYHNGSYYNYYHNNEYFLYFIDGAYYNYFYNGAYYVYLVNGRYYNYFYNGAYYQSCRKIPGHNTHGHWAPAAMVCH